MPSPSVLVRWTLATVAPAIGIFASMMSREWRNEIFAAFPFYWGLGPLSLRAAAFWFFVVLAMSNVAWQLFTTHREKASADRRRQAIETIHSSAVTLTVSRTGDDLWLWATNRGTHIVSDLRISATAGGSDEPLPPTELVPVDDVKTIFPVGGWFYSTVHQLAPDRGLALLRFRIRETDFTVIDFDVNWIDHDGLQRKSHGVADLRATPFEIALTQRPTPI